MSAEDSGFYAGISLGVTDSDASASSIAESLTQAGLPAHTSLDDSDTGFRLFAGYAISPYLSVEGGYIYLGRIKADSDIGGGNPGSIQSTQESDGFTLGVNAGYPINDALRVYGKLGLIIWDVEADSSATFASGSGHSSLDDSGTDLSFGLGAGYRINPRFAVRLDWDRYTLGGAADSDIDLFSAGVQVHF